MMTVLLFSQICLSNDTHFYAYVGDQKIKARKIFRRKPDVESTRAEIKNYYILLGDCYIWSDDHVSISKFKKNDKKKCPE